MSQLAPAGHEAAPKPAPDESDSANGLAERKQRSTAEIAGTMDTRTQSTSDLGDNQPSSSADAKPGEPSGGDAKQGINSGTTVGDMSDRSGRLSAWHYVVVALVLLVFGTGLVKLFFRWTMFRAFTHAEKRELLDLTTDLLVAEQHRRRGRGAGPTITLSDVARGVQRLLSSAPRGSISFVSREELREDASRLTREARGLTSRLSNAELRRLIRIRRLTDKADQTEGAKAIRLYKKVSRLAPWDEICVMSIGVTYANGRDYRKALRWLEKALKLNPASGRVRANLQRVKSCL